MSTKTETPATKNTEKKPPAPARTKSLILKLTDEEHATLKIEAVKRKTSMQAIVLQAIVAELARIPDSEQIHLL